MAKWYLVIFKNGYSYYQETVQWKTNTIYFGSKQDTAFLTLKNSLSICYNKETLVYQKNWLLQIASLINVHYYS